MTKIWHPKHGFVFSGDDVEIQMYLDTGGEIYIKKQVSPASPVTATVAEPESVKPKPIKQKDGRPSVTHRRHLDPK